MKLTFYFLFNKLIQKKIKIYILTLIIIDYSLKILQKIEKIHNSYFFLKLSLQIIVIVNNLF